MIYTLLSLLSLAYVSIMAWVNPIAVMNLVAVDLPNTDALSSIRGVYGGVGFLLIAVFVYLIRMDLPIAVSFLTLFWGLYAISRMFTTIIDGPLGSFGTHWLFIESSLCIVGLVLVLLRKTT